MSAQLFKFSRQVTAIFTTLSLLSLLSGCDSDEPSEVTTGGTEVMTGGVDVAEAGVMAGTTGTTEAGVMADVMGATEAGVMAGVTAGQTAGAEGGQSFPVVESCDELGANTCFANTDCAENARCQNVGPDDLPVACCVPGARGTLAVGEPCNTETGELECASALCVTINDSMQGVCSGACADESECPESAPQCIPIAFSGSELNWCFPADQ
jgi:hypothetical protein